MKNCKIQMAFARFSLKNPLVSMTISKAIEATLKAENVPVPCEINVLVTDDDGIRSVNKALRELDKATDVLSFPMFQMSPGEEFDWETAVDLETGLCPLGDMCISLQRAQAQAKTYGHSLRREIGYLTIHSMLHLLGYDHMDEGPQKAQMRKREEEIAGTIPGMKRN